MKITNKKQKRTAFFVGRIHLLRFALILSLAIPFSLFAQKSVINGVVVDSKNESIIGANVLIKGTHVGTITDFDGKFSIEASAKDVLLVSYIGMNPEEIIVGSEHNLKIVLQENTKTLDEVVVIGYGAIKKRDVTTAITTVSTKDLDQRPIVSADQALQGKAAGVSVVKPNGLPGEGMVIRVRGTTSMNSSNDPLYVVDGVTLDNISFLSANDIESMQVLKDASSAAIYGSRAANGVILITTKTGVKGNAKISLNAYAGLTSLTKRIESLNVDQYRELLQDMGSTTALPTTLTDQTDWYDETFQDALTQNYQLSISNATDKINYYLSAGYTSEEGIIKVAYFDRFNFRSNIENQIRPWLKVGANISYSDYKSNGIVSGLGANRAGVVLSVINTPTYAPVWDPDNPGQYYENFYGVNITSPVENMSRTEDNKTLNNRLISTGSMEITFLPKLKLKSSVTLDRFYNNYTTFLDPVKTGYGRSMGGVATDDRSINTVMIYDNILSYNHSFGLHNIDFMGGTSATTSNYNKSYVSSQYFHDGSIKTVNAGNKVSQESGTYESAWAMMSYVGRLAYNYDSKYLATVNMRVDGSSKLNPNHRWGYFPSASAAWRISAEKFMKDLTWIDDMKIRGGWGQTGNQAGLSDYSYLQRFVINRQNWWEDGNGLAVPIITMTELRNSDLTWETTTQTNFGIDLTILKSRLTFAIDYYSKYTSDMLMYVTLPAGASTASTITRNEGEMSNKGYEFSVNSVNIQNSKFKWSTDFNISTNKNMLTKLVLSQVYYDAKTSENITEYVVRNEPGHSLGGFYGYFSDGVDPETGELMYRDLNNDGSITTSDKTYIGDPSPDFTFGMTNSFSFKNFDLSILLQGSYGNDIFNASRMETEGMYDAKNQSTRVLERWRRPGMITTIPKAGYDMKVSSYFVEDGSFIRVKDVTLSYNVAPSKMKKLGITKLQPYVTASNLLTFTNYLGFDPEVNQWGNSGTVQGIDWGTYPQTRTFIVGLNVEF
jgi:TonB-dependent starch-binding outer membrane protein SusC